MKNIIYLLTIMLLFTIINSCKSNTVTLDEIRLDTDNLELRIIELMQKADTPFSEHEEEANQLIEDISIHYQNLSTHKKSEFALQQWNILLTSEKDTLIFTKYLEKWKNEGTLKKNTRAIGVSNARLVLRNIKAAEAQM